jgi:hypothetical protein
MNMIFVNADFDEPDFVTLTYTDTNIPERIFHALGEHLPPILCRKYQMVQQ